MAAISRFDLKTDTKEKAQQLLERETRITLSQHDFAALTAALHTAISPNDALQKALAQARQRVRRGLCKPAAYPS